MANSLRAKLSKLRHDRHITNEEYQELIKKLDGHDRELRAKAIDEFVKSLNERLEEMDDDCGCAKMYVWDAIQIVNQLAEQLKEGGKYV